ncbi:MAG: TdeIII family type II restriction endonuclease [Chloroflexi bacterium]|nr:TdeIII family type II restriction endonuclease [Chloroflexota bacterium]
MQSTTRKALHDLLKSFTEKSLRNYDVEKLKRAYPFHRLFFDEIGLVAFKQERSMVTKMGRDLYPELTRLIAMEKYSAVVLEKVIEGKLNAPMVSKIDQIVRELRERQRRPNHIQEMNEIFNAKFGTDERIVRVIADVYIGDFKTGPLFIELKTPQPNLDICAQSKSKILTFKTLLGNQNPNAYLAFYYNPFVTRAEYSHSFTKQIMDMNEEVLMGEEFWDMIGGKGTFAQLLEIIENVGDEIRKEKKEWR